MILILRSSRLKYIIRIRQTQPTAILHLRTESMQKSASWSIMRKCSPIFQSVKVLANKGTFRISATTTQMSRILRRCHQWGVLQAQKPTGNRMKMSRMVVNNLRSRNSQMWIQHRICSTLISSPKTKLQIIRLHIRISHKGNNWCLHSHRLHNPIPNIKLNSNHSENWSIETSNCLKIWDLGSSVSPNLLKTSPSSRFYKMKVTSSEIHWYFGSICKLEQYSSEVMQSLVDMGLKQLTKTITFHWMPRQEESTPIQLRQRQVGHRLGYSAAIKACSMFEALQHSSKKFKNSKIKSRNSKTENIKESIKNIDE